MSLEVILAFLLSLPQTATPEHPDSRRARIENVAAATAAEARTPEEAAAVLTEVWFESHLDPLVHAGNHPRWHNDKGHAFCLTQIHPNKFAPDGAALVGTDLESTRRCIGATLKILRSKAHMCGASGVFESTTIARVFYGYGAGHCLPEGVAPPEWAQRRAMFFDRVRARLWRRS